MSLEGPALAAKLDRLVTYRLSSTGLIAEHWAEMLGEVDRQKLMGAAIEVVKLVIPEWEGTTSGDARPRLALEAAAAWLASPSEETMAAARGTTKACTAARNEMFGRGHHVPEAARALARATGALEAGHLFDALEAVEAELLARIALVSEYERGPAQRASIVEVLRRELVPPPPVEAPPPVVPVDTTPVPYAASGHFVVGQRLEHKKFGLVAVVGADATGIEVELADGSKKRLVHKPAS